MKLEVDLSTGAVVLRDGDEMEHFSVRAIRHQAGDGGENGALGALAAALSVHDAGIVEPGGDILVAVAAVKQLAVEAAAGQGRTVGPEWDTGFASMLEYAATHGWLAEDGSIRAHVEWRG
jgi:hypothetical protein